MRMKYLAVLIAYLLLFSSLTVPAVAWCDPPCGPCDECIDESCIHVGCDPPCGDCYYCNEDCDCIDQCKFEQCEYCIDGCQDICTYYPNLCLKCDGSGNCISKCETNLCQVCDGQDNCISRCNSNLCQVCDGQGNCISRCDPNLCQVCDGHGNCISRCDPNLCQVCDGHGNCISRCDPNLCQVCDGHGNCISRCVLNWCQVCDGNGMCVSRCNPYDCEYCDGQGNCVSWCDPNQCEVCDGNGMCVSRCNPNLCQDCNYNNGTCEDRCTLDPSKCLKCDGSGHCISKCEPNLCQVCIDGTCKDRCTLDPNQCLKCDGSGNCISKCDPNCEVCTDGVCVPITIDSVSSDKDVVCVGSYVTFTATTTPAGHEGKVTWSAPGADPSSGSGGIFYTRWNVHSTKTATASLCGSSKSKSVKVCDLLSCDPLPPNDYCLSGQEVGEISVSISKNPIYYGNLNCYPQPTKGESCWVTISCPGAELVVATARSSNEKLATVKPKGICAPNCSSVSFEITALTGKPPNKAIVGCKAVFYAQEDNCYVKKSESQEVKITVEASCDVCCDPPMCPVDWPIP